MMASPEAQLVQTAAGLHPREVEAALDLLKVPESSTVFQICLQGAPSDDIARRVRSVLAVGRLTAQQAAKQLPPQLAPRTSPRLSNSKTHPQHARTFEEVRPWNEFETIVAEFVTQLDNNYLLFQKVQRAIQEASKPIGSAAKEGSVESPFMMFVAEMANSLAETLGCGASIVSGGSGRSASDTDQVVALNSLLGHPRPLLSELVLAPVEVKGDWQTKLEKGDDVVELLQDPAKRKKIELALQQLFGDMVEDEAPFGMLTTYRATVFLARHPDVQKKVLYCSRIYWQDEENPTFYAATGAFVNVCWKGRGLKSKLPRDQVPVTPVQGYTVTLPVTFSSRGRALASLSFSVKAPPPRASPGKRKRRSSTQATTLELSVVPYRCIGYTGNVLASGRHGNVVLGDIDGQKVVIKKYELRRRGSADALQQELSVYAGDEFKSLQGVAIPRMLSFGLLPHSSTPFIALSHEGVPLKDVQKTPALLSAAVSALDRFHAANVLHGDLSLQNLLMRDGQVLLCDFESIKTQASKEAQAAEKKLLLELLNEGEWVETAG